MRLLRVIGAALRVFGRRSTWVTLYRAVDFLLSNEIYTYASAVAFNALIAFFPAAIVVLTFVRSIGGIELHDEMLQAIVGYLPANQAMFQVQLAAVTQNFSGMTALSLGILLFSAVGIFVPIELALNYVWHEKESRHWAVSQALSFALLVALIGVAIVPVYLAVQFERLLATVFFFIEGSPFLNWCDVIFLRMITIPFTILGFGIVYWVLPKRRLTLEEVIPAALFAGCFFEFGRYLYILCLPFLGLRDMYGAFSVSVTFITWALFASMMMMMGAYLTAQELLPRVRWPRRSRGGTLPANPPAGEGEPNQ